MVTATATSDFFTTATGTSRATLLGFQSVIQFGGPGDIPVPQDDDGDGNAEIAVFRPWTSQWWMTRSSDTLQREVFGGQGDIPVPSN